MEQLGTMIALISNPALVKGNKEVAHANALHIVGFIYRPLRRVSTKKVAGKCTHNGMVVSRVLL